MNGHLVVARHPLRLAMRQVATYGVPRKRSAVVPPHDGGEAVHAKPVLSGAELAAKSSEVLRIAKAVVSRPGEPERNAATG